MQHRAETLTLVNDGQVPCQFEFIQKPNELTYCKPWLTANPHKGFVAQGGFLFSTGLLNYTVQDLKSHTTQSDGAAGIFTFMISPCVGASVDIDLEVFVNRSTAPDLNSGKERIEEILVLHLERGKDYFISVTGNYLPSCFGTSIRSLCQMREPIQDMPAETLRKLVSGTTSIHVRHLLVSPHSVPSLDSALRENLSCFFACL